MQVFTVTRSCHWCKHFWPWWLAYLLKTLTLIGYIFWMVHVGTGALTFHRSIPCYKTISWVTKNWPWLWCLTNLKKLYPWLYLLNGIYWGSDIFHMSNPCYKNLFVCIKDLTLWLWPWCLTYLFKMLTLAIFFKQYVPRLIFHTSVSSDKTFGTYRIDDVTLTSVFDLHVHIHTCLYVLNGMHWDFDILHDW
jgi:hypothetical protein